MPENLIRKDGWTEVPSARRSRARRSNLPRRDRLAKRAYGISAYKKLDRHRSCSAREPHLIDRSLHRRVALGPIPWSVLDPQGADPKPISKLFEKPGWPRSCKWRCHDADAGASRASGWQVTTDDGPGGGRARSCIAHGSVVGTDVTKQARLCASPWVSSAATTCITAPRAMQRLNHWTHGQGARLFPGADEPAAFGSPPAPQFAAA